MNIPDDLLCLFSARIEHRAGSYVIDIPEDELQNGNLERDAVFRIAVLPSADADAARTGRPSRSRTPPVEPGDVRTVEIENLGDQGDGIARVDRGYVVIVPGTAVGDEVEIEIEEIHDNFAIAHVAAEPQPAADEADADEFER